MVIITTMITTTTMTMRNHAPAVSIALAATTIIITMEAMPRNTA